jgi:hypothetical protein
MAILQRQTDYSGLLVILTNLDQNREWRMGNVFKKRLEKILDSRELFTSRPVGTRNSCLTGTGIPSELNLASCVDISDCLQRS